MAYVARYVADIKRRTARSLHRACTREQRTYDVKSVLPARLTVLRLPNLLPAGGGVVLPLVHGGGGGGGGGEGSAGSARLVLQ